MLSGCEHFRHKQAILPKSIAAVQDSNVTGVCKVLGEVAQEHDLSAQPTENDNVLCYFKREFNGFPLILGARIENDVVLVDVFSWNIKSEFQALEESVLKRLKQQYGKAVAFPEKPVPM